MQHSNGNGGAQIRLWTHKRHNVERPLWVLTYLPLDTMANISQMMFLDAFSYEKFCIVIKISLKFVCKGPIDNNPALVKIMACCRIGNKPLSKPMLTRSADAYKQH